MRVLLASFGKCRLEELSFCQRMDSSSLYLRMRVPFSSVRIQMLFFDPITEAGSQSWYAGSLQVPVSLAMKKSVFSIGT